MIESWDLAFHVEPDLPYTEALLDRLPTLGVSHIGVTCFAQWRDDAFVEKLTAMWERSGLKVQTYHAPIGLIFAEGGREKEALIDNERQVDIAAAWKAKTVVYHHDSFRDYPKGRDAYWLYPAHIGELHDRYGWDPCNRRFATMLSDLASYAAKCNVTVCLENIFFHPRPDEIGQILDLLDQVGGDSVGLCLDSSHAHSDGCHVGTQIRRARRWLRETHFSDDLGPRGWRGTRRAVGADIACRDFHLIVALGTIDWFDVCAALREIGYSDPIFIEMIQGLPGAEVSLETQARAIEMTIQNWRAIEFASMHLTPATEG